MFRKLTNKGETFIETLVATMIIVLVITGFASVVSSVTKVNERIKNLRTTFSTKKEPTKDNDWFYGIANVISDDSVFPYLYDTDKEIPEYDPGDNNITMLIDEENDLKSYRYEKIEEE